MKANPACVEPHSERVKPDSSQVRPDSGRVKPDSSRVRPHSWRVKLNTKAETSIFVFKPEPEGTETLNQLRQNPFKTLLILVLAKTIAVKSGAC